jgi:SAM-dependent methyltransferase
MTEPPDPTRYGREWAADYDRFEEADPAAVARLVRLAAGRPLLEVAAGTGRLALPLAEAGVPVTASDISPEMVEVLRGKDVRGLVTTRVESMAALQDGAFGVIVNAANSIWMLTTAQLQQEAIRSAAAHLEPGGHVVVEMGTIRPEPLVGETRMEWAPGVLVTQWRSYDPVTQRVTYRHTMPDGQQRVTELRWLTVPELLVLAAAAGLAVERVERGWSGEPLAEGEEPRPGETTVVVLRRPSDPSER